MGPPVIRASNTKNTTFRVTQVYTRSKPLRPAASSSGSVCLFLTKEISILSHLVTFKHIGVLMFAVLCVACPIRTALTCSYSNKF